MPSGSALFRARSSWLRVQKCYMVDSRRRCAVTVGVGGEVAADVIDVAIVTEQSVVPDSGGVRGQAQVTRVATHPVVAFDATNNRAE